jgi:hypothetical protein
MSEEKQWYEEAMPEGLRDIPFLKDSSSPEEFRSRVENASQYMGNAVRIPGPDATEEHWSEFDQKLAEKVPGLLRADLDSEEGRAELMKRLGRPENAEEYGAEGDSAWLADAALAAGLTKSQFASLVSGVAEITDRRNQESAQTKAEKLEGLFQEWGLSAAKKMEHIEGLAKLTEAPESVLNAIREKGLDAETYQWLDRLAQNFSQAQNFKEDRNDPEALTPMEAEAQIQELINNPELFANNAIGRSLQARMVELQKAASAANAKANDMIVYD